MISTPADIVLVACVGFHTAKKVLFTELPEELEVLTSQKNRKLKLKTCLTKFVKLRAIN